MKLKLNKIQRVTILITLGCFVVANLYIRLAPCPTNYFEVIKHYAKLEIPDLGDVDSVSPVPESKISWGCYTKKIQQEITFVELLWNPKWPANYGVTANVHADFKKAQAPPSSNLPYYEDTVLMYVDGQQVPIRIAAIASQDLMNSTNTYPKSGSFVFQALPFLFPGEHVAKIVYIMPSGDKHEYEWHFTIILW